MINFPEVGDGEQKKKNLKSCSQKDNKENYGTITQWIFMQPLKMKIMKKQFIIENAHDRI